MWKNLKWKFTRFMYGRYGIDQLYMASGILFIVLQLLQIFIQSSLLAILLILFVFWIFYRVFSKNIPARQAENQRFLRGAAVVNSKWKMLGRRMKDITTHRYRKCAQCTTTLRLPRKRGNHQARCPRCNHLTEVKIWI